MHLSKTADEALELSVLTFERLNIPYQVTGGLAAKFYGSRRALADIDFDIPEDRFREVWSVLRDYRDPLKPPFERYKDDHWDLLLMTLDYKGQLIDIGGAFETRFFDTGASIWRPLPADFTTSRRFAYGGLEINVVSRTELCAYKKGLARPEDLEDLAEMERRSER